ncbi:4'-phosphopantetheinyl transferase family protein [Streptomyces boluensis]|uniref:4'-phosphopantetheinyl transferase superfamily protein n=1 Tax=Streptomyces boluensis TaxID=1775135 RepID=A0A964UJM3_9ACTN|nr:4'-phosphopantetheinyl transferase superfamily protein [Streptomyces boluensis]NBE50384.1 4'-phosphopantetheinyl transferase superfamily protein [Streptomyces boluensis]
MTEELLPLPVVAVETYGDAPGAAPLFPEEARLVAGSVDKRRREFGTVRGCARRALAQLGVAPVPILPGVRGAPTWPAGFVGSMTHCEGYRGAAVARSADVLTVGLDAEPDLPLPHPGILERVTLPQERAQLAQLATLRPEVHWERLLFSAKESVYKAWFPLTGRWLDFEDALITLDPVAGTFSARLLVPGPVLDGVRLNGFDGVFRVRDGLLLTAIAVPAPRQPDRHHRREPGTPRPVQRGGILVSGGS